jgi:putative hemolysin
LLELAVVLFLILLNGVFALSELAVVSARRPRLRSMAELGRPGARAALALAEHPGRFLSTVQIGITLIGVLSGAFSGAALGGYVAGWLYGLGMPATVADPLGFGLVVIVVTYLSIVVGELVPKRLALRNSEVFACSVAPMMSIVSRVTAPVVWVLDASGNIIFRLLGLGAEQEEEKVTDEDLRSLVAEAERHGTIESAERSMIAGVLRLGGRTVQGVMTPRGEVDWIDATAGEDCIRQKLMDTMHSRLPVGEGSSESMIGVVQSRDLLAAILRGEPVDVRALAKPAPPVLNTANALDLLTTLRGAEVPVAFVHDEYGHFGGIVTPTDLTGAIVGDFLSDAAAGEEPAAVPREDGSWLLAGWMPADEMAERLSIALPVGRGYQTVAGFVLHAMGRLPQVGEMADAQGWRFEVVDLDGRRIDKILAFPIQSGADRAARRPGTGPDPSPRDGTLR